MIRMRDKNLTYQKLNIQLKKLVTNLENPAIHRFLREAVVVTPTLLENYSFSYPRNFRLLRTLCITQWYYPEEFHFRIWLDLTDMSFSHLNEKQILELRILLSSKENMLKYLSETNRYDSNEFFGNIVGNDLRELNRTLKISKKAYKLVKTQRRRGYNDHGSRKPSEKWLPDSDFSFTEYQLKKERKLFLQQSTLNRILKTLRDID